MYDLLNGLSLSGITVWPHPMELSVNGLKVAQNKMIWHASHSLGFQCPSIAILTRGQLLPTVGSLGVDCWGVVKRERSRSGEHCYLPEDGNNAESPMPTLRARLDEEDILWELGQTSLGIPRPRWFVQSYVPQLHRLGEIRFIFVNGTLLNWIYTTPARSSEMQVEANVPIKDPQFIRCVSIHCWEGG